MHLVIGTVPRIVLGGGHALRGTSPRCRRDSPIRHSPGNCTPTGEVPRRFQVTQPSGPASCRTCVRPGWATGLCTDRWIGSTPSSSHDGIVQPATRITRSTLVAKGFAPCRTFFAARSGDALMPGPLGVAPTSLSLSLALSLSLSHPDPIIQMPALSISKLLGDVGDKTTTAHCEGVGRERCVNNRAAEEPALAGGGTGSGGVPLGRMTTEARRRWALSPSACS